MLFGDLLKYLHLAFAKPACCKVPLVRVRVRVTLNLPLTLTLTL